MIQRAFIERCGRYGFVFENNRPDSGFRQSPCQPLYREFVVFLGGCARIVDRAADGDRPFERADLTLRLKADIPQHDRNQILERKLLTVDAGPGEQPARQKGFQRLNQPAFFIRREVPLDSDRAADTRAARLEIENRPISLRRACRRFEAYRCNVTIVACECDRTVRCTEVDADAFVHTWKFPGAPSEVSTPAQGGPLNQPLSSSLVC